MPEQCQPWSDHERLHGNETLETTACVTVCLGPRWTLNLEARRFADNRVACGSILRSQS